MKMASSRGSSSPRVLYFLIPILGIMITLFRHLLPDYGISSSIDLIIRKHISGSHVPNQDNHQYEVQIFSRDPLIIYIQNFVSSEEVAHLLKVSEDKYEPSKVYSSFDGNRVDDQMRVSESAWMDRKDPVVRSITRRAREFQGWRGRNSTVEPLLVQRYQANGFYNYHFDWDEAITRGNRVTTFMSYLVANCTGGGTNFPFLPQPSDDRWCDVIECDEEGRDGYQGVIFKPIVGSAIFWENFHPNGTGHKGVYHAGLPVRSGMKVGLNIWTWDSAWVKPEESE
ncbi:putative prolyl 4-hydroxylase alpha subunit [Xylaria flabelliformis]|nr:putative prolyl 4-hydroxylase alpha subunit [Xylaria flabelliformis]